MTSKHTDIESLSSDQISALRERAETHGDSLMVLTWAATTLSQIGCTLYPLSDADGWDVEMWDGSWRSADSWRDLSRIARLALRAHRGEISLDEVRADGFPR